MQITAQARTRFTLPATVQPTVVVFFVCLAFTLTRYTIYRSWLAFVDYDGFFNYFIAKWGFDAKQTVPLMVFPTAAYRYQRIIYPLSAYLLSLGGNPTLVPFFLVLLNILSIVLGTWIFALLLKSMGTNPWYSLIYGLFGSQFLSLMTSLAEPLAFLFIVLGIYLWTQKKFALCIFCLALAALTKETALLFVLALIVSYLLNRNWHMAVKMGFVLVPYLVWQIVLVLWLGKPGFSGGYPFEFPLWGWLSGFVEKPELAVSLAIVLIPMAYLPMLILGIKAGLDFFIKRNWHPYVLMILIHVAFMLVLPGATAREPAAMVRITQGLMVSALLYGSLIQSRRILNYSILWIATLAILVNGSIGPG